MSMGDDILATTGGIMKPVKPMNGKYYTLVELQGYVGGLIETLSVGNKTLVIDEEGKIKGKLPNRIATGWIVQDGYHDWIAGDALLISNDHMR